MEGGVCTVVDSFCDVYTVMFTQGEGSDWMSLFWVFCLIWFALLVLYDLKVFLDRIRK